MRTWIKVVIISGGAALLIFGLLVMGILMAGDDEDNQSNGGVIGVGLSDEVLAYKSLVEYYCAMYGIEDYVWYILAIMQVESGGRGQDVMQSSESLGLPPNSLSTEDSIKQGCYYFSVLLESAEKYGCDIDTVIQAYNYGGGFVSYVASRGKSYTFDLAVAFSQERSGGVRVTYTNPIAVEINGGWRYNYGNMFYVKLVRQYLTVSGTGQFIWPSTDSYVVTSVFGNRRHPITGVVRNHDGIDIGAAHGTAVLAADGGTITLASYYGGYGNCVMIDHGNGYTTLYGHMSQLSVAVGARVVQGQTIGLCGSTGNSTGPHIHYEVRYNGALTDPLDYYDSSIYTYG